MCQGSCLIDCLIDGCTGPGEEGEMVKEWLEQFSWWWDD